MVYTGDLFYRFNPTLVRLRRADHGAGHTVIVWFQSHAGSIEAASGSRVTTTPTSVSIPRWFD